MTVGLLGPLHIDGVDPQRLGGPQQRAVLALLAIRAGEPVRVGRLIDDIWGDEATPNAKKTIQVYVSALRRALADSGVRIETVTGAYQLVAEVDALDIIAFERRVREAESSKEPERRIASLEEAQQLWRGPPFADLPDFDSLVTEARRLEELRLHAIEMLLEAELLTSEPARLVGRLQSLVEEHPLRERLSALLMEALYRSGRQAEALRAYTRLRSTLAEELGIEPSADVQDLEQRILEQDPSLTGTTPEPVVGSVVRGYELLEELGTRASAVVFAARQRTVNRRVALKIIRPELASQPEFIRRFEIEAQVAASLEHPHVVPLYDFWRDPSGAYISMRLMAGGSLAQREPHPPMEWVLDVVEQVADALTFAHSHGVVHRDVRPANVMFDEADVAYLSDFTIAAVDGREDLPTGPGPISEYTPPELRNGSLPSPASDIWSLAKMASDLIGDRTSSAMAAVVERAMNEDPANRYPSASAFGTALRGAWEGTPIESPATPKRNPYKGLVSFQETDAGIFFGRRTMTEALTARVVQERFVAVVGPSGSGKSSVVRAGLIPALRRAHPLWLMVDMSPGRYPFDELAEALGRVSPSPVRSLARRLLASPSSVVSLVHDMLPDDTELVLIVDQFEELFTLLADPEERRLFLELVAAAVADPRSRVRIVITLRADFYHLPLADPTIGDLFRDHVVPVAPMAADEIEEAIVGPALAVGAQVELGLVAQMVTDVIGQASGLPLMQFALTELFDTRSNDVLTLDSYRQMGGLDQAIARRSDSEYRRLSATQQDSVRRLFLRLVAIGEGGTVTRRRALRSELEVLGTASDLDAILDGFGKARLLAFDHEPLTREPTVELAHEAMLSAWALLAQWIEDNRDELRRYRRLAAAAESWEIADHDPSFLLRGSRLAEAEALTTSVDIPLTEQERRFVAASVSERDSGVRAERERFARESRSNRRLRAALIGAGALLVAVAAIGALALSSRARAAAERDTAELTALVNQSLVEAARNPDLALLLAAEAYARDAGTLSQRALLTALGATSVVHIDGAGAWDALSQPDCSRVAATGLFVSAPINPGTAGSTVVLNDVRSGSTESYPAGIRCTPSASPDGRFVAGHDGTGLVVIDTATGSESRSDGYAAVAWAPDGRALAKQGPPGRPGPWVWVDPESLAEIEGSGIVALNLVFSEDGSTIVAQVTRGSALGTDQIATYDGDTLAERGRLRLPRTTGRPAVSSDGDRFGFVHEDGAVRIFDAHSMETLVEATSRAITPGFPAWLAFTPDGESVGVVAGPELIEIRALASGSLTSTVSLQQPAAAVSFLDDRRLAVLSTAGIVRVHDVAHSGLVARVSEAETSLVQPIECCSRTRVPWAIRSTGTPGPFVVIADIDQTACLDDSTADCFTDFDEQSPPLGALSLDYRRVDGSTIRRVSGRSFTDGFGPGRRIPVGGVRADGSIVIERLPFELTAASPEGAVLSSASHLPGRTVVGGISTAPRHGDGLTWEVAVELGGRFTPGSAYELVLMTVDARTLELIGEQMAFEIPDSDARFHRVLKGGAVAVYTGVPDLSHVKIYFAGERIADLELPMSDRPVRSLDVGWVAVSPDRQYAVFGFDSNGQTIRIDTTTGERVVLDIVASREDAAFLADGRLLVLDRFGVLSLWSMDPLEQVGTLAQVTPSPFIYPTLSENEDEVWLAFDGELVGIPLEPDVWLDTACTLAGRQLTDDEWQEFVPGSEAYDPVCSTEGA